jgi:hypothetical protein
VDSFVHAKKTEDFMFISLHVPRLGAGFALTMATLSAWAAPITLNTTWLDANSTLSLSQDAADLLALTSITVSPGGKASALSGSSYSIPISSLTVDAKLLPPTLAPVKALAAGSTLTFNDAITGGSAGFGNLALDFNALTISGDVFTPLGNYTAMPLFTFKVTKPLSFSLKGGISLNESLGSLTITDTAAKTFAAGLKLPDSLASLFTQVDFGTIDAKIVPWFRPTSNSSSSAASAAAKATAASLSLATEVAPATLGALALTASAAPVPEPSTWSMVGLGLALVALSRLTHRMRRH